jgi:hypothetical protein
MNPTDCHSMSADGDGALSAPAGTLRALLQQNQREEEHTNHQHYVIFTIFTILLIGSLIKYLVRHTHLPYTVVLLVTGLLIGLVALQSSFVEEYTAIAGIDPHLLLYIFLPLLIFESSFNLGACVCVCVCVCM